MMFYKNRKRITNVNNIQSYLTAYRIYLKKNHCVNGLTQLLIRVRVIWSDNKKQIESYRLMYFEAKTKRYRQ